MKYQTLLLIGLLSASFPVKAFTGQSLANDILQHDTMNGIGGIKMILMAKQKKCNPKLIHVDVVQQPTDIGLKNGVPVSGYWKEEWTIDCDGEKIMFPIKFVLDSTGASHVITVEK